MTALMTMAATARPPGIGDARVPCPLCGGLIHPVAGRCKHCKEDLTQFRAGRPQAAATLPALNGPAITAPTTLHAPPHAAPTEGYTPVPPGTNGQATTSAAPHAINAREGSQPILPPRQTGSWRADDKPASSLWRSWPMIVIGVAVLAIVTAVVIMVLPQDRKHSSGKKIGTPPPAPERMDVDPTNPKSSQLNPPSNDDPWANDDQVPSAPHAQVQPPPQAPMTPDPLGSIDPNDPNDLFGGLGGAGGTGMFAAVAFDHLCKKLTTCGGDPSMQAVCSTASQMMGNLPAPSCDAGKKCIQALDNLSCTDDMTNVMVTVMLIDTCKDAINNC